MTGEATRVERVWIRSKRSAAILIPAARHETHTRGSVRVRGEFGGVPFPFALVRLPGVTSHTRDLGGSCHADLSHFFSRLTTSHNVNSP